MRIHFKTFDELADAKGKEIKDPFTHRSLLVPDSDRDAAWKQFRIALETFKAGSPSGLADKLSELLAFKLVDFNKTAQASWIGALPSGSLEDEARLGDRAFLLSAIASTQIQSTDRELLGLVRVHALIDEFPADTKALVLNRPELNGKHLSDETKQALEHARLVASKPLAWDGKKWSSSSPAHRGSESAQFKDHPLFGKGRVGLIMGGAQYVKSYFFESAKLPELRGASSLLEYCNTQIVSRIFGPDGIYPVPECVIYSAGGTFLAFAPVDLMNTISDAIEKEYHALTLTAFGAAAAQDFDLLELHYGMAPQVDRKSSESRGFGDLARYLSVSLQDRRSGTPAPGRQSLPLPHQPEAHPLLERCTSCGQRPVGAFPHPREDESEGPGLCEPCARKALVGRYTKSNKVGTYGCVAEQLGWSPEHLDGLASWPSMFGEYLKHQDKSWMYLSGSKHDVSDLKSPDDLRSLAAGEDSIAVIYADGNNVSSLLASINSPSMFRQISQRLFTTCRESVFRSLAKNLRPHDNTHPFEILSIGGDDLLLIVPASKGLEIAVEIGATFETLWNGKTKPKSPEHTRFRGKLEKSFAESPTLSLAIGVVIADANTPIIYLRDLAEELLKEAKKKSRSLVPQVGKEKDTERLSRGAIDFQILKSTGNILENISDYRKKVLSKHSGENKDAKTFHFTARPYSLPEMFGLIATARELKKADIPRSQLYALRQAIQTSQMRSTLEYLYIKKRSQGAAQTMFETLDKNWFDKHLAPWMKRNEANEYETVLADLIEIMPFVSHMPAKEHAHATN